MTVPGAPTITSAKPGKHKINLLFKKPASDGGAQIIGYRAKCTSSNGGAARLHNGVRPPILVDHLTPAKRYTCTVAARNRIGFGLASAASRAVVVLPNPRPTVPGAPTITTAAARPHSIKVVFKRPTSNGGQPILRYRGVCTSNDGGATRSDTEKKSPIVVLKLSAGKTYTCTVAARNSVGLGPASAPSSPVMRLP